MKDENYSMALCEVEYILNNTDEQLIKMIPNSFINWIRNNKSKTYKPNLRNDIPIEIQKLLPETEAIISVIYRKYWSSEEEKEKYREEDAKYSKYEELQKRNKYPTDINEILKKNTNQSQKIYENEQNIPMERSLTVVKKENIFKRIINKIKKIFGHTG